MIQTVNYKKEKRRATAGIVASAITLALSLSLGLAGWFFFLDASAKAINAQKRERQFDPWEDGTKSQDAYRCGEIIGLSEEFAADFKETYHYYFAFDEEWYPLIVKMKGSLGEEFKPYIDAVYKDDAEQAAPLKLRGVAAPIEDDIREFAIECLNILYDEELITEDNFEDFMGVSLLDTTRKPVGRADFSAGLGMGAFGVVFGCIGLICLVINIKRQINIGLAQEREKESMRRAAAWQNTGYSDEPYELGGSAVYGESAAGSTVSSGVRLVPAKKSNMFLGILGAMGGSLLGVVLWLLISFAGFIAGFAGFVMLKCALKGYEKLSGRLDKKGAVISLVIAAFMVFFANGLEYVIALCRVFWEWDASFDTIRYVIMNFGKLMTESESWGGYYMNLVLGYGLSIWASYKVIWEILNYKE